jgi:hypothetical protein
MVYFTARNQDCMPFLARKRNEINGRFAAKLNIEDAGGMLKLNNISIQCH